MLNKVIVDRAIGQNNKLTSKKKGIEKSDWRTGQEDNPRTPGRAPEGEEGKRD